MKTALRSSAAFTLIEMIGVLAIMAILAGAIVPRALHSIDTAAVSAESQILASLGGQIPLYLKAQGAVPTAANWTAALAAYAGLSPSNLSANSRHVNRVYLVDPAANPPQRVMILSSMRASLRLPAAIPGAAAFQTIWQTADGAVPDASSWNGWSRWARVAGAGDFLVIERVNLLPVYESDLQSLTLTLNNRGPGAASYNLVLADGTSQAAVNVASGGTVILSNQRPKMRLNLYRAAGGAGLDYSYVLSTSGKTFDYNGTDWIPQ